jgi:hypothetical protein
VSFSYPPEAHVAELPSSPAGSTPREVPRVPSVQIGERDVAVDAEPAVLLLACGEGRSRCTMHAILRRA